MDKEIKGVIDICVQAPKITGEVLKAALKDFLLNRTEKKGSISFNQLTRKAGGKLESIEVTDNNIRDFLSVAAKYNVDFSLKRDSSTKPPMYHVFFATDKADNFQRAFAEYAGIVQDKVQKPQTVTVSREQMHRNAVKVTKNYKDKKRQKERSRQKEQTQTR